MAQAEAPADAAEVTLVANDGFRATFAAPDLRTYPLMLSIRQDSVPITRSRGGPLLSTVPNFTGPAIEGGTTSWWVFYVTHLVVDTAEVALRIGDCTLGRTQLAALPQPRSRCATASAWAGPAGPGDRVRVRVMAPVPDGDGHAVRLDARSIADTNVLLGLRFGADDQPIPARLGGPVVLVFPPGVGGPSQNAEWPARSHVASTWNAGAHHETRDPAVPLHRRAPLAHHHGARGGRARGGGGRGPPASSGPSATPRSTRPLHRHQPRGGVAGDAPAARRDVRGGDARAPW
ncbi:MAG: hypothetical protein IPI43_23330 [Sandaracinaceae bacterium]|nr:hypothetical protein [Sandaracinaceae bacterium]